MKQVELSIPSELLKQFCYLIVDKMGLHFPPEDWKNLARKLDLVTENLGFKLPEDCLKWLISHPLSKEHLDVLAKHLTVGETYFFREKSYLNALKDKIFPEIIYRRQKAGDLFLRIWCAACCTGEEPYSLAMLLHQLLPDLKKWKITIVATDINIDFLAKAKKGIYKEWSFRATPKEMKDRYFFKVADGFQILPEIQEQVTFNYINLADPLSLSLLSETCHLDLVVCNNVLIYFTQDKIHQVLSHLSHALVEEGWLVVSAVEVPFVNQPDLISKIVGEANLFQKKRKLTLSTSFIEQSRPPLTIQSAPSLTTLNKNPSSSFKKLAYYEELYQAQSYDKLISELKEEASKWPIISLNENEIVKKSTLLAKSYANKGQLKEAKYWAEHVIKIAKLEPQGYLLNATILQEMNLAVEAIELVKKALYLDNSNPLSYYLLGHLMQQKNKNKEADHNFCIAKELLQKRDKDDNLEGMDEMTVSKLQKMLTLSHKELK